MSAVNHMLVFFFLSLALVFTSALLSKLNTFFIGSLLNSFLMLLGYAFNPAL